MECHHNGSILVLMKKWILIAALALTGCDEGRIYPEDTVAGQGGVTVTVTITGAKSFDGWFDGYSPAVAGFMAGSEYALISKNLEFDSEGNCVMTLSGIPAETQSIEICVVDRLRRRVACIERKELSTGLTELRSDGADFSPEGAIQREIFNTSCINCHGGANYAAAKLNLTEGCAFESLVGVESVREPGQIRVLAGEPDESLLYRILAGKESEAWNYDHSVEITAAEKLDLIKNWIKAQ